MNESFQTMVRDYHGVTTLHPLGLIMVVLMGLTMIAVPRRYVVWPMIVIACFVASAQRIVIAGADFNFLRLMILFGIIRLLMRQEYRGIVWSTLDTVVVLWVVNLVLMGVIRVGPDFLLNRVGFAYEALGMYLLLRFLVREWDDIKCIALCFAIISVPVAAFFAVEWTTGRNIFSVFGGVPEITRVRDGRLRCQGAFSHSITAGAFWAAVIPLVAMLWWTDRRGRLLAPLGVGCALFIIVACASSTPLLGVMAAALGAAAFWVRYWMRPLRWAALACLMALHLVMVAPVWHLVARVNPTGASASYHRYRLIDNAIKHFDEWWLIGTNATRHWGPLMHDLTNQYVVEGVYGGLLGLGLFVTVIALAFRESGRTWRLVQQDRQKLLITWSAGVMLAVHCTNFLGVSYFGQINMLWFLSLAIAGSMVTMGESAMVSASGAPRRYLLLRRDQLPQTAGASPVVASVVRLAPPSSAEGT